MGELGEICGKISDPKTRTIKKDIKILLHRQPFVDKTNIQVPSVFRTEERRNKEDLDLKKTQVKSRTTLKNLNNNKLQNELYVNINILPSIYVPYYTKIKHLSSVSVARKKEIYVHNIHRDPKFNSQCVIRVEKFNINKFGMKSLTDLKTTDNKMKYCTKLNHVINSTGATESNNIGCEISHADHQMISSKAIDEGNKLITKSIVIPIVRQSISPKCLRKQVKKNYAEVSLNKSQEGTLSTYVPTKRVPIYKNKQSEDNKTKRRVDVYEFDELDFDGGKNIRNKKPNVNRSEKFDKSMFNILQKIEMKEAKLRAKNNRKIAEGVNRQRKRNEPPQRIIKKAKANENMPENKNCEVNVVKFTKNVENVKNILERENDHENKNCGASVDECSENIKSVEDILEREIQIPYFDDTNVPEDDSDDSGEFFDLGEVQHSTPVKRCPNINIISNVAINEIESSNVFEGLQPNANSTPLSNTVGSPWRFNQNRTRNPHFITLKSTALPSLQQDMVLDYVQLEKSERFSNVNKKIETPKKNLVQSSIRDFVNVLSGNISDSDKENEPYSNLFDYHEFSPQKIKSPRVTSNNKAKRNILGPRQDNLENIQVNVSTSYGPIAPIERSLTRVHDDVTYFGFDDDDEVVLPENRDSHAKPYRINPCLRKKQPKEAAETDLIREDPTDFQESFKSQEEAGNKEVGLFEDPEKVIPLNVPSKIYQRKRRRKRLVSVDVEEEESQPKKRNMMTKKEEAELEKWAALFNSECEEIEKFNLEIE